MAPYPGLGIFGTGIFRGPIVDISRVEVIASSQVDHASKRCSTCLTENGNALGGVDKKGKIKISIIEPVVDTSCPIGYIGSQNEPVISVHPAIIVDVPQLHVTQKMPQASRKVPF